MRLLTGVCVLFWSFVEPDYSLFPFTGSPERRSHDGSRPGKLPECERAPILFWSKLTNRRVEAERHELRVLARHTASNMFLCRLSVYR
jgi:hypothetical protein